MEDIMSYTDTIEEDLQQFDPSRIDIGIQRDEEINSCSTQKGREQCLKTILSQYPTADTFHDIAEQAIGTDDRDTIRRLTSLQGYLPIRWDAFVFIASSPILNTLLLANVLSPLNEVEAAYRIGNEHLIAQYTSNSNISSAQKSKLSAKYGYSVGIAKNDIHAHIQYLVLERITPLLSLSNYVLALGYALELGRTDVIDMILNQYTERSTSNLYVSSDREDKRMLDIQPVISLLSLTSQYEDAQKGDYSHMARETMQYLLQMEYLSVSPHIRSIIEDDPSLLDRDEDTPNILSISELSLILQYDAINMWKYYKSSIYLPSLVALSSLVHGQIRRDMLLSMSNAVTGRDDLIASPLIGGASSHEMDEMLHLHSDSNEFTPLRLLILTTAASKGYIEILDKYLPSLTFSSEKDIITVFQIFSSTKVVPSLDKNVISDLCVFLDYKYHNTVLDHIGLYISSILNNVQNVSIPAPVWERYLAAAIVNGNIPLIQSMLKRFNISKNIQERAILLVRQFHMNDLKIYRSLMRFFI